jgi:hypothetical protein
MQVFVCQDFSGPELPCGECWFEDLGLKPGPACRAEYFLGCAGRNAVELTCEQRRDSNDTGRLPNSLAQTYVPITLEYAKAGMKPGGMAWDLPTDFRVESDAVPNDGVESKSRGFSSCHQKSFSENRTPGRAFKGHQRRKFR